ncbi:MAG: hypothetical protein O3A63_19415 [Proteobacteria bacterium]|nr:hypothetical protein [Pseudomonadota bacterium]
MKPKQGKAIDPIKPAKPDAALEADEADPGVVEKMKAEQQKKKAGKYGSQKVKPFKPAQSGGAGAASDSSEESKKEKLSWIEIELIDEADKPIAGERYEITLPDGSVTKGSLDSNGFARIDGIDPGECQISWPNLDKDAWQKA